MNQANNYTRTNGGYDNNNSSNTSRQNSSDDVWMSDNVDVERSDGIDKNENSISTVKNNNNTISDAVVRKTTTTNTTTTSTMDDSDDNMNNNSNTYNQDTDNITTNATGKEIKINNDDEIIFGQLHTNVSTIMYEYIDEILCDSISKLPKHLSNVTGGELVLLQYLKNIYYKNADLFSIYCYRNIFTINYIFPKNKNTNKRQQIISIFLDPNFIPSEYNDVISLNSNNTNDSSQQQQQQQQQQEVTNNDENNNANNDNDTVLDIEDLSKTVNLEDIKNSKQNLESVQMNIIQLRQQLNERKQYKKNLLQSIEQLTIAQTMLTVAEETFGTSVGTSATENTKNTAMDIQNRIQSIIESCQCLQQLHYNGQQVYDTMIEMKSQQKNDNTSSNNHLLHHDRNNEIEWYEPNIVDVTTTTTTAGDTIHMQEQQDTHNKVANKLTFEEQYENDKVLFQDLSNVL